MSHNERTILTRAPNIPVVTAVLINELETTLPYLSASPSDAGFYAGWHFDLFGQCCRCTGDCCVAWFCPCFALGQVARKLANNGVPTGGWYYRNIVFWGIVWILIDSIIASGDDKAWRKSTSGFYSLFCVIVMTRLRGSVRARYNIQGSCFADCLLSWWCAPCTLTQMVGQLWIQPEVTPGCDISEGPAFLV
mmetsp:Transcript_83681/g.167602  ORF Transcript_83681/g.167602 Transcript_83681/m.167602 type:complete len:192 (+) Transcript_83681:95-670(+)